MNQTTKSHFRCGGSHLVTHAVRMLLGAAIVSVPAVAALAQAPATSELPDTVVVTGSRIVRDGMTAPTPVSVLGADRMEQRAGANVGDMLNELPAFRATNTPATGANAGYVGGRILDLRGLGSVRTLVLVDGKRFVPSTTTGTVDTNMIPSSLLERAEVVTGGASAAYGSDAVAGVVNFILNENLTGLKSNVEFGQSDFGDNTNYSAKIAGGLELWGGRGHFIGALEYEKNEGIGFCTARDWCKEEWLNFGRPNVQSGLPANNILPDIRPSTISNTGVINPLSATVNGPLRGISFNADGTPRLFQYGTFVNTLFMTGGENENSEAYFPLPIRSPTEQYTLYTRTKFDFTDSMTGRLDLSYGHVEGLTAARQLLNTNYSIARNNPYIPTSTNPALDIRTIMDANAITSFLLGKNFSEFGAPPVTSRNDALRAVAALNGDIGGSWTWDGYYQYGRNDFRSESKNVGITARVTRAIAAVRNTAGQIVCAVNNDAITTNDDPACVPVNPFGIQANAANAAYMLGTAIQTNVTTQNVVAGNVQGELFSTWAGPISLASGLEYRSDKLAGDADAISQSLGFITNNASLIAGQIKVSEGYLETIIPLAKDVQFAENIELNGAVRRAHYDRSGAGTSSEVYATTWKMGAVWEPIQPLRLRFTKSRDVRAPNVSELFGPSTTGLGILNDPAQGGAQRNPVVTSGSNPNLVPEVADTTTYGFVIQPNVDGWLGRMQLSVDYYDIEIEDAIGVLGAQTIVTRCFQGATEFCPLITRDSGGALVQINDTRNNVDELITKGYDVEFSYRQPIASYGDLDFRLLATFVTDLITVDSAGPIDRAGQTGLRAGTIPGIPDYTLDGLLNWSRGPLQLSFHSRYIPAGSYNAAFVGPEDPGYSTALGNSSNTNRVRDAVYMDLVGQYDFSSASDNSFVVYAGVNNLNNQDPPRTPGANGSGNNVQFDAVGRTYKVGVRFKY